MSDLPVSVIIPTFNRVTYLERALLSVQKQSASCSEIIIVDDGSTDSTKNYVLKKTARDSRIKYFFQENKGPAAARNLGILKSKYNYIAFLDSDDHWHKKKLDIQYNNLFQNKEYLISHTFEKWFRRGKHLNQKKIHIPRNGNVFDHCLQLCAVGVSTVMAKKELFDSIGYFDETMRCCEDYDFWLRVSCKEPFLLISERLTIKEGGRDDQVSYQYRVGMDRLRIEALLKLIHSDDLSSLQKRLVTEELVKKAQIYGNGCVKHSNLEEGNYYLNLAEKYIT